MIRYKKSLVLGLVVVAIVAALVGAGTLRAKAAPLAGGTSFNASCVTTNYDPVSGQASCILFAIPPGTEVVIETVACSAEVAAGQGLAQADLNVPRDLINYRFPLAMTLQTRSQPGGRDIWAITSQITAYGNSPATGSTSIGIFFRASLPDLSPPQGMSCTIAGHSRTRRANRGD
jgi:hypothetical protein